jgi:hypothetical protein
MSILVIFTAHWERLKEGKKRGRIPAKINKIYDPILVTHLEK